MPMTRSASNTKKSSSSRVDANLKKNSGRPTSKNRRLEEEINRLHNEAEVSVQPRPVKSRARAKGNSVLHVKVKELELEVRRLKKARTLDRKKIRQLRLKEVHKDAEELQDERVHGVPDEHSLKKLLWHFHRVVSSPSLGEDEECPICAESLELNKCSSLPCQHIFCDGCLSKMSSGENISCPQCRRLSDIDFEPVEFTATQQWDKLLEIAHQFAVMEGQLGPDTSEEEEKILRENFIDDGDSEAGFVAVAVGKEHDTPSDGMQEDKSDEGKHILYSESGVSEKRRRMMQLVAERQHKRMRL